MEEVKVVHPVLVFSYICRDRARSHLVAIDSLIASVIPGEDGSSKLSLSCTLPQCAACGKSHELVIGDSFVVTSQPMS